MKIAQIAVATALALLLLTWLVQRSTSSQSGTAQLAVNVLDEMSTAEGALHRDLLRARAGILNNYDPLVAEVNATRDGIPRLRALVQGDPAIGAAVDRLAATIDLQEEGTERIKSSNALLRNSLAYFRLFSAQLSAASHDPELARRVGGLTAAMLHLTLDTGPEVTDEVDQELRAVSPESISPEGLSLKGLTPEDAATVRALLAHAGLLRRLLPATDHALKVLFALPVRQQQDEVRAMVMAHAAACERRASLYRYLLYGVSLALLGALIRLGIGLEARARHLRRRANIEHVIAGISTRFIDARTEDLKPQVERALAELAACIGAERAYFIVAGEAAAPVYRWSAAGAAFPPGWPYRAFEAAGGAQHGVIHVTRRRHAGDGDGSALAAAALRDWLAVLDAAGERPERMLGFDGLEGNLRIRATEFGLWRMAFDAIAHAIDRAFMEHEREHLEAELQQAHRMETIGIFTSGIAHNFNNIVGAILGYAEMAQARVPANDASAEGLGEIRRAGERARDLIDQLLFFGRRREPDRRAIRLDDLIAEVRSMIATGLPPNVGLTMRLTADRPILIGGEPGQLQQVLLNICNNAIQALDGGGSVEIETSLVEVEAPLQLDRGRLAPGSYALISVSDDGRGMDRVTMARIFEPFFTTREDGNGLGLATALEIVREHGGGIDVESAPGEGTRFDIWLRRDIPSGRDQPPVIPALGRGSGETVLILESDATRLMKYEEILAALGYEPAGFTAIVDAQSACRAEPWRFDMAVVCQPRRSEPPLALAAVLHQAAPALPIVLAVPSSAELAAPALALAGVVEIVGLPLTSSELATALMRCRRVREPSGAVVEPLDKVEPA